VISYEELVDLMLALHDPAGNPGYRQYASLILAHDDEQLAIARQRAKAYEDRRGKPLLTRIDPLKEFWPAEDYHQKYYLRGDTTLMARFRGMFGSDEVALRDSPAASRVNGYVAGSGTQDRLEGEIGSLGLGAAERAHLDALVDETARGGACALP